MSSVRSLSPTHAYGRRRNKRIGPGRRHSRQDIEAFYLEGKRLQEVEEARDVSSEVSVPSFQPIQATQDGMIKNRSELLDSGTNLHDEPNW